LSDGTSWLWSPVEWSKDLQEEVVAKAGPIRHLVSPNKIHWLFMKPWKEMNPGARMYASPGLAERNIADGWDFDATLDETPNPSYAKDIDQTLFDGGVLEEIFFFHRPTKTVILCDFIQRFPEGQVKGLKGWILKADGMVGPNGGAPKEIRFLMRIMGCMPEAREVIDTILMEWQPEKLIIAHGDNAKENASTIVANSFHWLPVNKEKRNLTCGCFPKQPPTEETSDM